jgi:hypothetical protein
VKQCGGKNGKFLRWVFHIQLLMGYAHRLKRTKSIFPDFLLNNQQTAERRIELEIPVEITEESLRKVVIMPLSDEQVQEDPSCADCNPQPPLSLTTLPPIILSLTLPLDYPLRRPPAISGLHATYGWLPEEKLKLLERSLLGVWEVEQEQGGGDGRAILYDWIELVRSAEPSLGVLGMVTNENVLCVASRSSHAVRGFSFM